MAIVLGLPCLMAASQAGADPTRLSNISTRMQVLTGGDVMIAGFVIGGSTPKTVAITATGPSLAPFGISNFLANPKLTLVRSSDQSVVATNDDWQGDPNAAQLQAAGFAPGDPREAGLYVTLDPGAYTAIVQGVGGGTGVSVAGVFEIDHPEIPLVNISTRGKVLTGGNVMIGGLNVSGSAPQTVVISVTGPSLAPFGISNFLADPVLTLVRSSDQSVIATNDSWQAAPNAADILASGFAPGNAAEPAIMVTLDPGAYTAIVQGVGGGTGVAVVGVFTASVAPVQLPPVPVTHPRILGAELTRMQGDFTAHRAAIMRFKNGFVDPELNGDDLYQFEEWHAALMGVATGQPQYCAFAVQGIDKFLDDEAARMQAGDKPEAAADSYLDIGGVVGNIALVYDWCYGNLTATQKLRWGNYADRFVDNVWNQDTNHWGPATAANNFSWEGTPQDPGSSWAVDNPFNNYYYSFLRATMLWGLASKGEPGRFRADSFLQKFRNDKLQRELAPQFEQSLQGGGSREGTGYGTAMGDLFGVYWFWEKTTGERVADLTSHTHASMAYMINAISPSRDFLAPIGDQSRDSSAAFYDYHRKYLLALASLYKGTPMARTVRDWLAGSTRPQMGDGFNWVYDVLYDGTEAVAPAVLDTAYYGPGTGHFFSRSGQGASASWLTFITGPYTESHAHQDGLSIMLFKNGWLVQDAGTLSHSGLQASQQAHALVTQTLAGAPSPIDMTGLPADLTSDPPRPENSAHLRALAAKPLYTYASSDQGNLFVSPWDGDAGIREEREIVHIMPDVVVVFDRADHAGAPTTKRFQLPMAGPPVISGRRATYSNGTSTLTVHALQPAASTLSVTHMPAIDPDFDDGYRLDSTVTTGSLTQFLNVLSVDGAVTAATAGADAGSVTLTLSDGRTVALSFHLASPGGTIEIRNAANQVLVSEPLPSTVQVPPAVVN